QPPPDPTPTPDPTPPPVQPPPDPTPPPPIQSPAESSSGPAATPPSQPATPAINQGSSGNGSIVPAATRDKAGTVSPLTNSLVFLCPDPVGGVRATTSTAQVAPVERLTLRGSELSLDRKALLLATILAQQQSGQDEGDSSGEAPGRVAEGSR